MPYGHRTGVWGDERRGTADTVRIPYRCRTDTVRAYGGCTARNRGWAWASRLECGVSRDATPLHTPCASSISPIMWMSRGCHTARFNNRGISYGYRTDIVRTYGGCTADVRRMYSEIPYGYRTGTVRIPYGYHGTPPSGWLPRAPKKKAGYYTIPDPPAPCRCRDQLPIVRSCRLSIETSPLALGRAGVEALRR